MFGRWYVRHKFSSRSPEQDAEDENKECPVIDFEEDKIFGSDFEMIMRSSFDSRDRPAIVAVEYNPRILYLDFDEKTALLLLCSHNKPTRADQILVVSREQSSVYSRILEILEDLLAIAGIANVYETAIDQEACTGQESKPNLGLMVDGLKMLPKVPETKDDLDFWMCVMPSTGENFFEALLYCRDMYKRKRPQKSN